MCLSECGSTVSNSLKSLAGVERCAIRAQDSETSSSNSSPPSIFSEEEGGYGTVNADDVSYQAVLLITDSKAVTDAMLIEAVESVGYEAMVQRRISMDEKLLKLATGNARSQQIIVALFRFVAAASSFLLMLITMTYNLGLFLAICLGFAVGRFYSSNLWDVKADPIESLSDCC